MTREGDNAGRGNVDGALRWVGDLDHPFYNDERQRFVWYEASAIGFQLMLMLQTIGGGITLLLFGNPAWKYVLLALAPTVLTTIVVTGYASRHGAPYFASSSDFKRSRGIFAIVVMLIWAAGVLRAGPSGGDTTWDVSTIAGFITGIAVVGLVAFAITRLQKRSQREVADD